MSIKLTLQIASLLMVLGFHWGLVRNAPTEPGPWSSSRVDSALILAGFFIAFVALGFLP